MSRALPAIGVNLPWLGTAYGHDLGRNQAYPDWPAEFDWWRADRLLALLKSRGVSLLRCWLFEDGEGLMFDDRAIVTGLDSQFLENLGAFARLADRWGMRIFWTLLDANGPRRRNDIVTRAILTCPDATEAFIAHALDPVLHTIARTAWAIDLCNEPEAIVSGHLGNGTALGFDWWHVTPQLAMLCHAVRKRRGSLAVSVGSGFHDQRCIAAGLYEGLALDALSFHSHAHDAALPPPAALSDSVPVLLGELGWPLPGEWDRDFACWECAQRRLVDRMKQAITAGYPAIFLWFVSDIVGNADSLVCDGHVSRALELLRPFQASGVIARVGDVTTLPLRSESTLAASWSASGDAILEPLDAGVDPTRYEGGNLAS